MLKDLLAAAGVNAIAFANGVEWTREEIANFVLTGLQTAGNDAVVGTAYSDTITGGAGNDTLSGGQGSDVYVFESGSGTDTIVETDADGVDAVSLGASLAPGNVSVRHGANADDLVIDTGGGNSITVSGQFTGAGKGIEEIVFSNGTVWSRALLASKAIASSQTGGADTVNGSTLADRIAGGAGNDALNGGDGADSYVFNRGDGADTIADTGVENGADRIEFGAGIAAADVDLFRSGANDLTIALRGSGDKMVVKDHFLAGAAKIGVIKFADGTLWNGDKILDAASNQAPLAGTALADKAATQGQAFSFAVPT